MSTPAATPLVPMLPAERRTVAVVALVAISRLFGLFALLPVVALFAAELSGATPLLVGLAVGGYGLTQAALQLPLGALSDRIGRIPVVVGGLSVFVLGSVVAATSDTIYGVIAGRLLQGGGAVSATLTALLSDATREEVRTRAMAVLGIGVGSTFMLALVAGPAIAAVAGVRGLFFLAAGMGGAAALMLVLLPGKIGPPQTASRGSLRAAFRPELLRLDLYILLLHGLLTALFVGLPFLLSERLGLPLGGHWPIYVLAMLLSLLGTVPLIVADDRGGRSGTVRIALFLLLAGAAMLAFAAANRTLIVAALAVFFAGFNFLEAGLPARLSILARRGERGASLGLFSSSQFLGAFLGGLAGGALLSAGRPTDVFLAALGVTGCWFALHAWSQMRRNGMQSSET